MPEIKALTSLSFGDIPSLEVFELIYSRSKYLNSLKISNFKYSTCVEFLKNLIILIKENSNHRQKPFTIIFSFFVIFMNQA